MSGAAIAEDPFPPGYVDGNLPNPKMGGPLDTKRPIPGRYRALPVTVNEAQNVQAQGDSDAALWVTRGTRQGESTGVLTTGNPIAAVTSGYLFRSEVGEIAECLDLPDAFGMREQLGTEIRQGGGR
jgi:hypothetical protein